MNSLAGKAALASIPAAGIAGTGAYFGVIKPSLNKETIKSKLEKENKGRSRRILDLASDGIWAKFRVLYKNAEPSKKIQGVEDSELPSWCETTLKKYYSEKEYSHASEWCVANTNTLKLELESKGLNFITFENSDSTKWQNAWTKYEKDKSSLEIEDASLKNIQSNDATAGGSKLQAWCKAKLDKYMYEDLGESKTMEKVEKYCVTSRASAD
ncbi:hypothetical protein HF1_13770 [Mycoplasma haemofelis str. Langford 1]|uniref:Uncharacterized protein n=1 Tax=Mycoplasma haemofelis (strain Langford 1) TaxID=941640 RepID=E8ZJR4_MYCHL|nr:hypothetical protein [Mycoplasma haemofelis]CBY93385.1 hypothetical protein HF1_13770 [Mycoplasma haemofelis str. Langford 1]